MTTAPTDLGTFRTGTVIPLTGLQGNDVGIAPDASHLSSGGYHVGCEDIQAISKWNTDYSTRQARDRLDGTNVSSALDIGDDWPRGGRAAWLRFNNLLVGRLRAADPALAALRATNFSPDGSTRKRYDSFNPSQGVIDSTDSVTIHTHLEFWRDTVGTPARARALARVGQVIDAAIRNVPLPPEGDDMALSDTIAGTGSGATGGKDRSVAQILGDEANLRAVLIGEKTLAQAGYGPATPLAQLLGAVAEDKARDTALAAAVNALAVGAGADPQAVFDAIEQAVTGAVKPLQEQLAAVQARNLKLAGALAAAGLAFEQADD